LSGDRSLGIIFEGILRLMIRKAPLLCSDELQPFAKDPFRVSSPPSRPKRNLPAITDLRIESDRQCHSRRFPKVEPKHA
jgi:hypothetical protein